MDPEDNQREESLPTRESVFSRPRGRQGRGARRKAVSQIAGDSWAKQTQKSDLVIPKLPANGFPLEHPYNKDSFRYILAEPDPHAPFRQEFDENQDLAGKAIPGWLYRKLSPQAVLMAMHDRAPQLKISEGRLTITGEKGYCMARATHGVHLGNWFYEVTILEMPDNSATRIGWSQELGNLQGPCGYDKFSYSWRSRKGTKFHESRGYHFADEGYCAGDTLGFFISLPEDTVDLEGPNRLTALPQTHKEKPLVKFKNYLYFEEKDEIPKAIKDLKPLKGSQMIVYKNGRRIGTLFSDFYSGLYYPAASFYKNVSAKFNFGPQFKYPPQDVHFKAMSDFSEESAVSQTVSDLVYFVENEGKLRLDTFYFNA